MRIRQRTILSQRSRNVIDQHVVVIGTIKGLDQVSFMTGNDHFVVGLMLLNSSHCCICCYFALQCWHILIIICLLRKFLETRSSLQSIITPKSTINKLETQIHQRTAPYSAVLTVDRRLWCEPTERRCGVSPYARPTRTTAPCHPIGCLFTTCFDTTTIDLFHAFS